MQCHELKTWPAFYQAVAAGDKTVEVRKDDRGFNVGDLLHLREFNQYTQEYTGASCTRVVTHILRGGAFGIQYGHVVMSIAALAAGPTHE